MEVAIFVLFAVLAVASALVVITHKNPVYSTMSLVLTFFSVAVLYVLLGAPFIATLQILVYTGAILVLFLFVLMLLNVSRDLEGPVGGLQRWGALVGVGGFAGIVGFSLWRSASGRELAPLTEEGVSIKGMAAELFERYLLHFELVGLLLLVAVIAATVVARKSSTGGTEEGEV